MDASPTPPPSPRCSKALVLGAAKVAVSVALIAWILGTVDTAAILARLVAVPSWALVLAGVLELVALAVAAWRWQLVLGGIAVAVPYAVAARLFYIGQFINSVLPANIGGDIYRTWRVFADGRDLLRALMGVALDRAVALVGLAVLAAPGIYVLLQRPGAATPALVLIVMVAGVAGGLVLFLAGGTAVPRLLGRALPRLAPVFAWVAQASLLARAVFLSRGRAPLVVGLAALVHGLAVAAILVLAQGLGVGLSLGAAFALIPPVILVAVIPISYGGWGVREGAMAFFLGYAGVAPEAAVGLSLLFGGVNLLATLPAGLWWLAHAWRPQAGRP